MERQSETQSHPIHFHSSDDRFCGTAEIMRRFTMDPNDVTCLACQRRDTFTLSEDAMAAYVASLEARPER